ncbi:MAG: hypothetical protein FWF38_08610, partial [Spirochaetaceae bacterium]|nr:hypothetical protein [Spirochaetaceae bacterium]
SAFPNVTSILIEDRPFDSGGFGEVYLSKEINKRKTSSLQAIKILFTRDNNRNCQNTCFFY